MAEPTGAHLLEIDSDMTTQRSSRPWLLFQAEDEAPFAIVEG